MKVLLVNPTKERLFEQPSLGLLYVAGALKQAGHSVEYLEGTGKDLMKQLFWRVARESLAPDVIGFTVMSPMFSEVKNLIELIRENRFQTVVVAGGAHATIMPQTLIDAGANYVIRGEGEGIIVKLLDVLKQPNGKKIIGHSAILSGDQIWDLDSLAAPARELLPRKYLKNHSANIMASRGCPYNCLFCQPTLRRMFGEHVRMRSPSSVVSEMVATAYNYGVKHFEFFDDTFTANKVWIFSFCGLLKDPPFTWECLTRVNAVDPEMLYRMREAGCKRITFGVESGSQKILDFYRKGITIQQIRDAFEICRKVGIHTHALFMIGAPMETHETIAATEKLIDEIKPNSIFISITTPLPETDMWNMCAENREVDWSQINYYHKPLMKLQFLSADEVVAARERILKNFYLRHPGFAFKLLRKRGWSYTRTALENLF